MKYIEDENIILEDPFVIRPGIDVTVRAKVVKLQTENWDMTSNLVVSVDGLVTHSSIKGETGIPYNYIKKLEYTDDIDGLNVITDIEIEPFAVESTPIDVDIYYLRTDDVVKTSKSALSSSESAAYNMYNYEYIVEKDGNIIPMTLINIVGEFDDAVRIEKLELITDTEDRGITQAVDNMIGITSHGTMTMGLNALRKGRETVDVAKAYGGSYLEIDYAEGTKKILIDNQEKSIPGVEFFGLENVGDVVFIITDDGLYGFNKWNDFINPINVGESNVFHWSNILGTDLTYIDDDSLVIANGTVANKYYLRHDFTMFDKNNNRILFREPNPEFDVV